METERIESKQNQLNYEMKSKKINMYVQWTNQQLFSLKLVEIKKVKCNTNHIRHEGLLLTQ